MSTMNPMKQIKTVTISHVGSYKTRKARNKSPIIETFDINNLEIENPSHQISQRSNISYNSSNCKTRSPKNL